MSKLLWGWLSMSLSGSLLICAAFVLTRLFQRRVSRTCQYYLWLIVIARLLLPFSPQASLMGNLFQNVENAGPSATRTEQSQTEELQSRAMQPLTLQTDQPQTDATQAEPPLLHAPLPGRPDMAMPKPDAVPQARPAKAALGNGPETMLVFLWLGAALGLFLNRVWRYQGFHRYLRTSSQPVDDLGLLEELGAQMQQMKIRRPIRLYANPSLASPVLTGFFRPLIALPDPAIPKEEFRCTILHELTHYKRMDFLYKWLAVIAVCLHWFNPLAWFMDREISRACELSCDETVIRHLDRAGKRRYGDTLLHAAAGSGALRPPASSAAFYEGKELLKERLESIMTFQKSTKAARFGAWLMTGALLLGAIFLGAYFTPVNAALAQSEDKSPVESGYYTQNSYFTGSHIVEIGYNLPPRHQAAYPAQAELTLSDGSAYMVRFSEQAKAYAFGNERGLAAVRQALSDIKKETAGNAFSISAPFVVSIKEVPKGKTAKELSQLYYDDDRMTDFSAVFAALEDEDKNTFADAIYQDGRIAYFGSVCDRISKEHLMEMAMRSVKEQNIPFFSVSIGELDQACLNRIFSQLDEKEDFLFYNLLAEEGAKKDALVSQNSSASARKPQKTYPLVNEQSIKLSGITTIQVEYKADPVYLLDSPTEELILKEYLSVDNRSYMAGVTSTEGNLKVLSGSRPEYKPYQEPFKSRIEIYIPKDYSGALHVNTVSGGITSDLTGSLNLFAQSTSGNIRVSGGDGRFTCGSTSGGISIEGSNGTFECQTTSGNIRTSGGTLNGSFSSTSGSLHLEGKLTGDLDGRTTSGSITLSLPGDASFELTALSDTGDVTSQFRDGFHLSDRSPSGLSDRKLTGKQGSEPYYQVTLQSGSGNVRLEKSGQ